MLDLSTDYLALMFMLILLWEYNFPREVIINKNKRWFNNLVLYVLNQIIKWTTAFLIAFTAIKMFPIEDQYNLTIFLTEKFNHTEYLVISFFLLDFFLYALHRLFHHFQFLWRLHLVHHSDVSLDVTTNFRHHPFEQVTTSLFITLFIWLGQFSIEALTLYGIISTIVQIWHHGNINVPTKIEQWLNYLIITPSIHRIHHRANRKSTDSNYGAIFSLWDRLFNSFIQPDKNTSFIYGLEYFRAPQQQTLLQILKQPFHYLHAKNTTSITSKTNND